MIKSKGKRIALWITEKERSGLERLRDLRSVPAVSVKQKIVISLNAGSKRPGM